MVANFLAGGAVVNAFARQIGADVVVVDVGVTGTDPVPAESATRAPREVLWSRRVRAGTADLSQSEAMSRAEALTAIETGIDVAVRLVADGYDCLITGVATPPEQRRRGIAGWLVWKVLDDARAEGLRTGSLQATKAGAPLYERMGFADFGFLEMWELRR